MIKCKIKLKFLKMRILEKLEQIKEKCTCANIEVFLSISVDGIDDMQDFHRGKKDAFKNAEKTIELILAKKDKYVDYIDVISTITKYNICAPIFIYPFFFLLLINL